MRARSILVVFFLGSAVSAQTPAEDVALARQLFHEGVELAEAESWTEASDRFRRAQRLRPSTIVAYNLSIAATHAGHLVEATEMLQWVRRRDDVDPTMAQDVEARWEALRTRLASTELRLTGAVAGIEVRLDGRVLPAEALGVRLPVDPGPGRLEVVRGGEVVASSERTFAEGEHAEWELVVPAPEARLDPAEVARAEAERARREAEAARDHAAQMEFDRERARARRQRDDEARGRTRRRRVGIGVAVGLLLAGGASVTAGLLLRDEGPGGTLPVLDWR